MHRQLPTVCILCWFLTASLTAGCGGDAPGPQGPWPPAEPFTYEIDTSIAPSEVLLVDPTGHPIPVVAFRDRQGVVSEFVQNELLYHGTSRAEAEAYARDVLGGEVVGSNEVPPPPPGRGIAYDPVRFGPTFFVIRFDPDPVVGDLDGLEHAFERAGLRGPYTLSSETGARLLAHVVSETGAGRANLSPNFVSRPLSFNMLHEAREADLDSGSGHHFNPFGEYMYRATRTTGAWQLIHILRMHGSQHRVGLAVIDGGFWLDEFGAPVPLSLGAQVADFWDLPGQYDFHENDLVAGGPNPSKCTGGATCDWHGNASASIAGATMDNEFGGVGTGSTVARLDLLRVRLTDDQIATAVRCAAYWGNQVISMSFGGACHVGCQIMKGGFGFHAAFQEALDEGAVLVAAAGNDNVNVDQHQVTPCVLDGVICVGALEGGDLFQTKGYSNYGFGVDIWAPSDIFITPNPDTWDQGFGWGGGTSASCPFVAGIAAMVKYVQPDWDSHAVRDALVATGVRILHAGDPKEPTRYVDALAVVNHAQGGTIHRDPEDADVNDNNDSPETATPIDLNWHYLGQTLHNQSDVDYYRFELSDYSGVVVDVEYMVGLGHFDINLIPEPGMGAPSDVTDSQHGKGRTYTAAMAAPGTYLLKLNKQDFPSLYNFRVDATPAPLQPDKFENNDYISYADNNGDIEGAHLVTLHTSTDRDFYRFSTLGHVPGVRQYHFEIVNTDIPLRVMIYDKDKNFLADFEDAASMDLNTLERFYVRVAARNVGDIGRYTFRYQAATYVPPLPGYHPADRFWWLDPSGPVSFWLYGMEDYFVIEILEPMGEITVHGRGVGVRLLGENRAVLAEGTGIFTPAERGGEKIGERIPIDHLPVGGPFVVHLFRETLNAGESTHLGAVTGTIEIH